MWSASSRDLSLIKNGWAILQDKVDEVDPPSITLKAQMKILKDAWSKIGPEVLQDLSKSVLCRLQTILDAKGGFAIKYGTIIFFAYMYLWYCFKGT